MDNTRTPNVSPPAPLDGVYRYEVIQTTGIGNDNTYYIDLWFIYGQDHDTVLDTYDDALKLKTGEKVVRNTDGSITVLNENKPKLTLVVDNE